MGDVDVTFKKWYDFKNKLALFVYFCKLIEDYSGRNESITHNETAFSFFFISLFFFLYRCNYLGTILYHTPKDKKKLKKLFPLS